MAVIANYGNTNLSTANGFYRAEAFNMSPASTTLFATSTTRVINVTFANPGNLQTVAICLYNPTLAVLSTFRTMTITLKESGVTRDSVTLTPTQIFNGLDFSAANLTNFANHGWIVAFNGFTYAVTTTPAVWTLEISETGGTYGYQVHTSDGTNICYAAICDNTVTFANNDCLIVNSALGRVTIDQTATIRGVLGTGSTTIACAGWICKNTDPTVANVASLVWENPPASSYTFTINGGLIISSHAGFRAGTLASPIPYAEQGTIAIPPATVGSTLTTSGFWSLREWFSNSGSSGAKASFFMYGEVPASRSTTLSAPMILGGTCTMTIASPCVVTKSNHGYLNNMPITFTTTGALPTGLTAYTTYYVVNRAVSTFEVSLTVGGASINTSGTQSGTHTIVPLIQTTDTTGWTAGDTIVIGGATTKGQIDSATYTIQAISGNLITPTVGIAAGNRSTNGTVLRTNRYGLKMTITKASSNGVGQLYYPNSFIMQGVEVTTAFTSATSFWSQGANTGAGSVGEGDTAANIGGVIFKDCCFNFTLGNQRGGFILSTSAQGRNGFVFDGCHVVNGNLTNGGTVLAIGSLGNTYINNKIVMRNSFAGCGHSPLRTLYCDNNVWDSSVLSSGFDLTLSGTLVTFTNNRFWAAGGNNLPSIGSCASVFSNISKMVNFGGNSYDNCFIGIVILGPIIGVVDTGSSFGLEVANSIADIIHGSTGIYTELEFANSLSNINLSTDLFTYQAYPSRIRFSNYNSVTNVDFIKTPVGDFYRTGYNLADTTVRTSGSTFGAAGAGKFAIRFDSTSPTQALFWEQSVPTGDIQNRTMSVNVWCKMNAAAYYAGVNVLPKLTVTYDNGTTVEATATASTTGQVLSVNFTPATSYGQITVKLSTQTDATTSNAYVYFDDLAVLYPSGYSFDLGGLDLWANALPVTPSIATLPNPGTVWDELTAGHVVPGSFGEQATRTDIVTNDNQALILAK